jgi:UV DNA damage endonuclease
MRLGGSRRLPVVLGYQEEQPNQSTALKRELAIKALSRKAKEALIQSGVKQGM